MKVVILADHASNGGAAQAMQRIVTSLHSVLARDDCLDSVFFFPDKPASSLPHRNVLWYEESATKRQLGRLPRKLLPSLFPRPHTPEFAARRLRAALRQLQPDLINVHNLHAAAPWGWGSHLIEVCLEVAPVVWTLHDMWSFTGRCAYSYDCEKFITGCDASCPTPHELPQLAPEKIHTAWAARRSLYERHRDDLVIVTPSRWLAQQARRGLFASHRIEVIPYGLSWCGEVGPGPRAQARRQLGIHPTGFVLLLAAHDLTERRKGAEILPQLWHHIKHRPLTLLTMGHGVLKVDDPCFKVQALGWIEDSAKKMLAYGSADALLHPAPVDNFPNVVLEAFASGTPVIAMPIGGLPEMVRPGVSGWLADAATPEALGQAVNQAVRDLSLGQDLSGSCRILVENEYASVLQGRRYVQLFKELLKC